MLIHVFLCHAWSLIFQSHRINTSFEGCIRYNQYDSDLTLHNSVILVYLQSIRVLHELWWFYLVNTFFHSWYNISNLMRSNKSDITSLLRNSTILIWINPFCYQRQLIRIRFSNSKFLFYIF